MYLLRVNIKINSVLVKEVSVLQVNLQFFFWFFFSFFLFRFAVARAKNQDLSSELLQTFLRDST